MHASASNPRVYDSNNKASVARSLFQTYLNLGNAFLKFVLLRSCPSAQNQSHGQIVHKFMLFAERDCRVSPACDNHGLTAQLMHPEAYRSCQCFAERMLRCLCITASVGANPQRLIGIAEQPQYYAIV